MLIFIIKLKKKYLNKSKCEPYWDDDKVLVVDNIEVKVIKPKKNKNCFIKRAFELTKTVKFSFPL